MSMPATHSHPNTFFFWLKELGYSLPLLWPACGSVTSTVAAPGKCGLQPDQIPSRHAPELRRRRLLGGDNRKCPRRGCHWCSDGHLRALRHGSLAAEDTHAGEHGRDCVWMSGSATCGAVLTAVAAHTTNIFVLAPAKTVLRVVQGGLCRRGLTHWGRHTDLLELARRQTAILNPGDRPNIALFTPFPEHRDPGKLDAAANAPRVGIASLTSFAELISGCEVKT